MQNIPPIILYLPIATELCVFICHDFAKDCGGESNTLVRNQQVVRRKIHLNQLSGEFGVHMSYSLKLKNVWLIREKGAIWTSGDNNIFFIELY